VLRRHGRSLQATLTPRGVFDGNRTRRRTRSEEACQRVAADGAAVVAQVEHLLRTPNPMGWESSARALRPFREACQEATQMRRMGLAALANTALASCVGLSREGAFKIDGLCKKLESHARLSERGSL
jgi:hypothetical protein